MDKKLNPLDGEIDLLGDTVSDIIRKLNPLTGRLELVYKADSYIQKINPFIGDFDMVGGASASYIIKEATGNGYINLTNAVANHLMELKAYGGTEQRNLPSGYTQLDSITSTGNSTYILSTTDIANLTKAEIDVDINNAGSTTQWLFGKYAQNKACSIEYAGSNGKIVCDIRSSANRLSFNGTQTGRHLLELDVTDKTFTVDNTLVGTAGTSGEMAEGIYGLVGCFYTNFIGNSATYYGVKAWENNVLVYDLVPCKNANDEVGMFNLVNGQFMGSDGEGTFTAGNEILPTPSAPMDIVSNNGVLKYSKNMCDVKESNIDIGHYISSNGVYSESVSNFLYIPYIKVQPNTTYTLSFSEELYYITISEYSANDGTGFIQRNAGTTGGNTSLTVTTTATTQYIRFGSNPYGNSNTVTVEQVLAINWQLERGDTPTPYHEYVEGGIYVDGTTETIWVHTKNLFSGTVEQGGLGDSSGAESQSSVRIRSTAVPIKPNTLYNLSWTTNSEMAVNIRNAHFYDASNTWISRLNASTFTTPPNTAYVRFVWQHSDPNVDVIPSDISNIQLELGSTATTYVPYYDGGTATAEMLLKIGDYVDEQEILSGNVTRKIGIKVLDGTENWSLLNQANYVYGINISDAAGQSSWTEIGGICTHLVWYTGSTPTYTNTPANSLWFNATRDLRVKTNSNFETLNDWKQFLTDQYNAGTPVIVIYPLATPTTETVAGQTMNIPAGNSTIEITQASIDNLGLYAKYKATA